MQMLQRASYVCILNVKAVCGMTEFHPLRPLLLIVEMIDGDSERSQS